jgi:hypothetical protein
MPLEVLNFAFMLLGGGTRFERAQIPAFASFWILLTRIQTKLTGC